MRTRFHLIYFILIFAGGRVTAAPLPASPPSFLMLEWNVENLFDVYDDPTTDDDDFMPEGAYRWTWGRYYRKLDEISKVIVALGRADGTPPDMVALCEVESDTVMTHLTRRSPLRALHYDYAMTHGSDSRGINVALMWLAGSFVPTKTASIPVPSHEHGLARTRDILYVRGLVRAPWASDRDTLHVLVAHLPSRQGGHDSNRNRLLAARTLWAVADSLLRLPNAKVVVTGDFNATGRDRIFRRAPLRPADPPSGGSYCYRGEWSYSDHFRVSPALARMQCEVSAHPLPWLIEPNPSTGRDQPFRTFRGPSYHGGLSDHLPMRLEVRHAE